LPPVHPAVAALKGLFVLGGVAYLLSDSLKEIADSYLQNFAKPVFPIISDFGLIGDGAPPLLGEGVPMVINNDNSVEYKTDFGSITFNIKSTDPQEAARETSNTLEKLVNTWNVGVNQGGGR
jgi:hypothetical protein